jgi:hypothetical protein
LTSELSRTLDDPHDLDMPCTTDHAFSPVRVVTGSMKPEGLISIGDNIAVTRFDGTFKALAVDGTYDLVAHTDSQTAQNRVAFRRNVVVAGDTAVTPAIDLAVEGVETMSVTPTVTNLDAGETLGVAALLTTPTTTAVMHIGGVVLLLPAVALGPRDTQSIRASGTSRTAGFRSRSITRRYTPGNSVEFVLPPPLDVQYTTPGGQPVVTWDPLPRLGNLQLGIASELDNNASLAVEHDVYLSSSYLATTGATSAAFDTDLPGYNPTWRTDVTLPWGRGASASGTDGGDAVSWLYQEDVTP